MENPLTQETIDALDAFVGRGGVYSIEYQVDCVNIYANKRLVATFAVHLVETHITQLADKIVNSLIASAARTDFKPLVLSSGVMIHEQYNGVIKDL